MKELIVEFLKNASVDMVEKKASVCFFGEKKIPHELKKELEKRHQTGSKN